MENFDLIIFTIVVTVSFVVFGISTYNEFSKAAKKDNR
jgi:hypothetical protein